MRGKIIAMLMLFLIALPGSYCRAWTPTQEYIKHPSNIPLFANYTTPTIEPGNGNWIFFDITNRYNDPPYIGPMDNCTLKVELYGLGTIDYEKKIAEVKNPPTLSSEPNRQQVTIVFNRLNAAETVRKSVTISTTKDTEEGTYFVRFNLTFTQNGAKYTMLSRGFFSDEDWKIATDPNTANTDISKINMTYLYQRYGCIAIIPDTAFQVKYPIPVWPFYLLLGITIMFAALAVVFYLQEEHDRFPRLQKALQKWTGKFHQSRRLLKKGPGKT